MARTRRLVRGPRSVKERAEPLRSARVADHRHDFGRVARANAADLPEAEALVERNVARIGRFEIRGQPLAIAALQNRPQHRRAQSAALIQLLPRLEATLLT